MDISPDTLSIILQIILTIVFLCVFRLFFRHAFHKCKKKLPFFIIWLAAVILISVYMFQTDSVLFQSFILAAVLTLMYLPLLLALRKWENKRKLTILIWLSSVILLARIAVAIFIPYIPGAEHDFENLNVSERILDSFVHVFQTFSMDEGYTDYIRWGKEILIFHGLTFLSMAYGFMISILHICAPLIGGAILLEVLAGIFPNIRLWVRRHSDKLVFSEVNDASVSLAEDIFQDENLEQLYPDAGKQKRFLRYVFQVLGLNSKNLNRPLLVFTDAYPNTESEEQSEMLDRARKLGAVCIQDDLLQIDFSRSRSVRYFLMDLNPISSNMAVLAELVKGSHGAKLLWPGAPDKTNSISGTYGSGKPDSVRTTIYTFTNDARESAQVWEFCEKEENASYVLIRSIRDHFHAAVRLMNDVPLFYPLMAKEQKEDLTVTILGHNLLAEEIFKAVYWCGQNPDTKLHIHVLSSNAGALERRIRDLCPELLESCREGSPLLKVHPFGQERWNPPYASEVRFRTHLSMSEVSSYPEDLLEKTDYWIISLGSDEKNIHAADGIRHHVENAAYARGKKQHPVIAPAVEDSRLSKVMLHLHHEDYECDVIPFGSWDSRFSCQNVLMLEFAAKAEDIGKPYDRKHQDSLKKDEYKYWANTSRVIFAPYQMYQLGRVQEVRLDNLKGERCIWNRKKLSDEEKKEFAWLEHRRWNAFMRAQGYRVPSRSRLDLHYEKKKSWKDIRYRYHNCLVEADRENFRNICSLETIPAFLTGEEAAAKIRQQNGQVSLLAPPEYPLAEPLPEGFDPSAFDMLDYTSMYTVFRSGGDGTIKDGEYKQWDYPTEEDIPF